MIKVCRGYSFIESVKNCDMFSILVGIYVIWQIVFRFCYDYSEFSDVQVGRVSFGLFF